MKIIIVINIYLEKWDFEDSNLEPIANGTYYGSYY
jgi:hypothetical protein